MERLTSLCLAGWNADIVRGRKLEMEHFLSQHGVDICLLSETFLNPEKPFRLANCLPPHRQTNIRGDTTILVRRGIVHHSVPVPGLTHLEATGIQVTLAVRPLIVLVAYLSPSRPLTDLSACFGRGCRS